MRTVTSPPRAVQASLSEHAGLLVLIISTAARLCARVDLYFLSRLPCHDLAFRLRKLDATRDGTDPTEGEYHGNLDDASCGCPCKGYVAHGHCKHRTGLLALRAEGRLP
jgi:hypothetical protein